MFVVPTQPQRQFLVQRDVSQRDLHSTQEFMLHRSDQAFDHGDAAALADGAKAGADALAPTPALVSCSRPELAAFIADEIPRGGPGGPECSAKNAPQRNGSGRLSNEGTIHHATRVVVEKGDDPPAKWPTLG
jgi:hypothetical protein